MYSGQSEIVTMGTFLLNGLEFGVDILQQREVLRMMSIVKVPCAARFIEGVVNLRGMVIPIVNLRARFGMPHKPFDRATRILSIEVTDSLIVGFIVDSVGQMRRVETNMIEAAPVIASSVDADCIQGVAKFDDRLMIVLNTAGILSADELHMMDDLA